eukprot:5289970-Pleurochrysis_carterae.AAC.1
MALDVFHPPQVFSVKCLECASDDIVIVIRCRIWCMVHVVCPASSHLALPSILNGDELWEPNELARAPATN